MAILYLDSDDEITSAAARIRTAGDVDLALVLPAGSRIATSRINFRLLAREAAGHSRRLSIVTPEASTRALAASAGLPAFASVVEYEEVRGSGSGPQDAPPAGTGGPRARAEPEEVPPAGSGEPPGAVVGKTDAADRAAGTVPGPPPPPAVPASPAGGGSEVGLRARGGHARPWAGQREEPPAPSDSEGQRAAGGPPPPEPVRTRGVAGAIGASTGLAAGLASPARRRRWPLVAAVLVGVALLAGAGAAVGYVLLPTATVTLRLAAEPVGPIAFTGIADPDAVAIDAVAGSIPATRVPLALSATGTFTATGKRVESSRATGQVRWSNCDPTRSYTIPKGAEARTGEGVAFRTLEAVFLPVAILEVPRITCQNRSVDVRAVREGPAGNVGAGTITVVPGNFNDVVIKVTNPAATAGGAREEFPLITEKDVTAAVTALTSQLDAQLAAVAPDPPGLPEGAIAYPETARRDEPVPSEPLADLVDREVQSFDLTLAADGTVVAADPAPLEEMAAARIAAAVPEGMSLREGSLSVAIGEAAVNGETISYPLTARAEAAGTITAEEVRALVVGKTAEAAREALAELGSAEVALWPDWATTVTTIDARLTITIEGVPPVSASPAPSSPGSRPSASPAPVATPSGTEASPAATAAP